MNKVIVSAGVGLIGACTYNAYDHFKYYSAPNDVVYDDAHKTFSIHRLICKDNYGDGFVLQSQKGECIMSCEFNNHAQHDSHRAPERFWRDCDIVEYSSGLGILEGYLMSRRIIRPIHRYALRFEYSEDGHNDSRENFRKYYDITPIEQLKQWSQENS